MPPIFEKHSEKEDNVEFYKVDVDEQQEIAEEVANKAVCIFASWMEKFHALQVRNTTSYGNKRRD